MAAGIESDVEGAISDNDEEAGFLDSDSRDGLWQDEGLLVVDENVQVLGDRDNVSVVGNNQVGEFRTIVSVTGDFPFLGGGALSGKHDVTVLVGEIELSSIE